MNELRLRPDDLNWREIDGEVVAVDAETSTYLSANPAGALLWQMLAGGSTREAMAQRLVDEYGIELERASADIDAFVNALQTRGLLES
jgi:hypothetical protein